MPLRKYARLIAATLVVLAIVAAAMWPESMEVDAATVDMGPMQVTIDEDGETRVRDRFVISAPVSGRLQRIELEPGDRVIRGKTVLVRLTSAESPLIDSRARAELAAAVEGARAAVGQAQAERERAAATLARARSNLRRQEELEKAGLVARDSLEAARHSRQDERRSAARRRVRGDARRVRASARARASAGPDLRWW